MKEEETTTPSTSLIRESQSVDEDFLNTYRNLPELWDTDHEHYTNKYKRNAALDVLLRIFRRWNPSATRINVRQKINILRSCYRKDLNKHLASKRIGPNGEEIYEYQPKNWKFHALRFLDRGNDNSNQRNDISLVQINLDDNNFEEEEEVEASNESASQNDEPSSHASDDLASATEHEPPRKRLASRKSSSNKRLKVQNEYFAENGDLIDRELEAIGANVTCKLKRMNPQQRYHAELLLNKVLITGLKNNLTDDTDLTDVYRAHL